MATDSIDVDEEQSIPKPKNELSKLSAVLATFLSPSVHALLVPDAPPSVSVLSLVNQLPNLSLKWSAIELLFYQSLYNTDHHSFSKELHSIANHVHTFVSNETNGFQMHELVNNLYSYSWTHDPKVFIDCLKWLQDPLDIHLSLLLCTAAVERSLGDVYLHVSKAKQCPKLLKDLLFTKELETVLGKIPMFCLQCLIGPPSGFNLRNIVWHGFFAEGEIPKELVLLLLVICGSLDELLVPVMPIIHRPPVKFPQEDIMQEFPDFKTMNINEEITKIFHSSSFIVPSMVSIWHFALGHFKSERYGWFISLVLPCMEHSLRCTFAHCNGCPERVLTAESSVLYTTFDEILSPTMQDGVTLNKLLCKIGVPYMEMLMDLLVHPEGPRLRDKISHGEVDLSSVSKTLGNHVLGVAIAFCGLFVDQEKMLMNSISSVMEVANGYRSLFHPCSILKRELKNLLSEISKWNVITSYQGDEENGGLVVNSDFIDEYWITVQHAINQLKGSNYFHCLNLELFSGFSVEPMNLFVDSVWNELHATLFMNRSDLEITGLLRRSVVNLIHAIKQIRLTAAERYTAFISKQLRSRQRVNLDRLLSNIGLYRSCVMFTCILVCVGVSCYPTPSLITNKVIRFYKKVLQFSENFLSQSLPTKNCWEEVEKHCRLLVQHCSKLQLVIMVDNDVKT